VINQFAVIKSSSLSAYVLSVIFYDALLSS